MRHGSHIDPPNRFEKVRQTIDLEQVEWDEEHVHGLTNRPIEYIDDASSRIVSENDSPDIPFRYSINPYRGCIHGCAYCYARPGHEYLGLNAGLDFETKIVVKRDAAKLLRKFLARKSWKPEAINFSGVTDCYQPAERKFGLTRECLEVAWECRQPVSIVTKNALILRDLDLLQKMSEYDLVHVFISVTTLKPDLAREMEPRTSIPSARLRAIETLANAQVPVGVLTAPIIPGLNDSEIPTLLKAASEAGALTANYILLRLPLTVEPVFIEWLERVRPNEADKVIGRLKQSRDGKLSSASWGERMTGKGEIADQIRNLYRVFRQQHGLENKMPRHNCDLFRPPKDDSGQMELF